MNLTLPSKDSSLSSSMEDLKGKINILKPRDTKDPVWESYDQISLKEDNKCVQSINNKGR